MRMRRTQRLDEICVNLRVKRNTKPRPMKVRRGFLVMNFRRNLNGL